MAKSFLLREAPQVLQHKMNEMAKAKVKAKNLMGNGVTAGAMRRKAIMMAKEAGISEFSDGMGPNKRLRP